MRKTVLLPVLLSPSIEGYLSSIRTSPSTHSSCGGAAAAAPRPSLVGGKRPTPHPACYSGWRGILTSVAIRARGMSHTWTPSPDAPRRCKSYGCRSLTHPAWAGLERATVAMPEPCPPEAG